jgi:hypothetical protein
MQFGFARLPRYAAGLAVIATAAITGCSSSSSTAAAPQVTPLKAVQLAAYTSSHATSFTGTFSLVMTTKPGAPSSVGSGTTNMTMTIAEQLKPSLLLSADITSLTSDGQSVPGGMSEVITPSMIYLKAPFLTQAAHLTKPWISMSLASAGNASGINLSQLVSQATNNSPLSETQMFAGATSVRRVGTGTVDGVPVTEYAGTVPMSAALAKVSSALSTQLKQQISTLGLTTENFTVWLDGQNVPRKADITVDGKYVTESINLTIAGINQPVHITAPPASQTGPMPGL